MANNESFKITIPNFFKHNQKSKKSYTHFLLTKNFFNDHKVAQLSSSEMILFIYLISVCADLATDCIIVASCSLPRCINLRNSLQKLLVRLQSLQLLTYEKNEPLIIRYNKIRKEVVEKEITTTNKTKDFENTFSDDYQKINGFIKFHKLQGLKIHTMSIYKHFITHASFLEEINAIAGWKKFPKDIVVDDSNNRTFTIEQKRIVTVSILKSIGVIAVETKTQ